MKIFSGRIGRLGKVLALMTVIPALFAADDSNLANRKTLVVNGNGEVSAAPDQAVVRLGASIQVEQAAVAQARVNEIMQAALTSIEKLSVPRKSIRSSNLTLSPVYSQQRSSSPVEPKVVAYRAANTIEVTVTDLALVGKIIDAGIAAGANELQGVSFTLKNDANQRMEALSAASEEAKVKAAAIAKSLGISLAGIVEVTEGGVNVISPREFYGGPRMMMAKSADMSTPVEPGEVRISASVTVRYEIQETPKGKLQ
jgi:uncharacterized protein YggE